VAPIPEFLALYTSTFILIKEIRNAADEKYRINSGGFRYPIRRMWKRGE
jgi:hypothetical protein